MSEKENGAVNPEELNQDETASEETVEVVEPTLEELYAAALAEIEELKKK